MGKEPPGGNPATVALYMANWGTGRVLDCQFDRDNILLVENPNQLLVRGNTWHGGHGGIVLSALKHGFVMPNVRIHDNMLSCHRPTSSYCATIRLNESVARFATSGLFLASIIDQNMFG